MTSYTTASNSYKKYKVTRINGGRQLHQRLMALGVMPGHTVEIATQSMGNMILKVGNSRIALGKGIASKLELTATTDS